MSCPFCAAPASAHLLGNELAFVLADGFPVSPGHRLIVPRRCTPTWFDASGEERAAMLALVDAVKRQLDAGDPRPDGYNIGINVGAAAGQTVMHLHVHVIPRFRGDMDDPRGGVRHVIPWKGNHLRSEAHRALARGGTDAFLDHIRPYLSRAEDVAIIAAFVQDSGLERLERMVTEAVARGARVRLITGDYLHVTQAEALARLLDWTNASGAAEGSSAGGFEARVVVTRDPDSPLRSFHPKSWRFEGPGFAVAWVGSSNVSATALGDGIEWNLRIDRDRDAAAYAQVVEAFDVWWERAREITADWVARYAAEVVAAEVRLPPGEAEDNGRSEPPTPHEIQREALKALDRSRAEGRRRALVVLATGLGKTWLAVWDVEALQKRLGRMPRVLFLAHRSELLAQAATVLRSKFRDARFGWFSGDRGDATGDVVFASVQKLGRKDYLDAVEAQGLLRFDYVIVDEVHHATAEGYRRVLARIDPGFLLGLTATPDRMDEADVLGLFDENLAYRADLGRGISENLLAPFAYHGLRDVVDYANIPWRNRRFDPAVLAREVATEARMARMWEGWIAHPGLRTLVFCCSIAHAEYVRTWLTERGVRVVAVHSDGGSADRDEALTSLAAGSLDAVCNVDLFNEGVDVPAVDRVVMLRPTESPVVFLQQLGRGLRRADGKERLTVIDFVGNHRSFLDRVRNLISLGPEPVTVRQFLRGEHEPSLPPGCLVDVELEAKDMLARFIRDGASEVERIYRELRDVRGARPTAAELLRAGASPKVRPRGYDSWFEFVAREGDLDPAETQVLAVARDWLREVETTARNKSFKMVVLAVLLDADRLEEGMALDELAARSHAYLSRMPELFPDLEGVKKLPDPRNPDPAVWADYWAKNPIAAWAEGRWFRVEGPRFLPAIPRVVGAEATLARMTRELVDYRLVQYVHLRRGFKCKIISNGRDPIVRLPARSETRIVPTGEEDVRLPDGTMWRFRFMKEYVNVARPAGTTANRLPDLLRTWFGPAAGRPGTAFCVQFRRTVSGWSVEPVGEGILEAPEGGEVIVFPSFRAAAGAAQGVAADAPAERRRLATRVNGPDVFAVRAVGNSMDGGERPIRDGDWLVMRWARAASLEQIEGKVALVVRPGLDGDDAYQVKRIVREGTGWLLHSDRSDGPTYPASHDTVVVALLVDTVPDHVGG